MPGNARNILTARVCAAFFAFVGLLCAQTTTAQRLPDQDSYSEMVEREAAYRARQAYEQRRAAAHARMPDTMYASTPSIPSAPHAARDAEHVWHEQPDDLGWRIALNAARSGLWRYSVDEETAEDVFREHVSPVVQAKCINCHVAGGTSGHTPLVFVPDTQDDHLSVNQLQFEDYLNTKDDGANTILNRIRGSGHGGGEQVRYLSPEYRHFERFLRLLGGVVGNTESDLTADALFDDVGMAEDGAVFRRAALIFAGRAPTAEEYASLGDVELRNAIKDLMDGTGFHEFLIRAANDRLLTDREHDVVPSNEHGPFVAYVNRTNEFCEAEKAGADPRDGNDWNAAVQYAAVRAPLELIAHVVENDLPYTDILTAPYVMANPQAAEAYGADTEFDDPADPYEFRPSEFESYYLNDDTRVFRETDWDCNRYIEHPGDLPRVEYPHAGILNSTVFMRRYPTTATNRNRARSRWTYYHFLGLDVEKSASRTTDAEALKDTNNPTLNNGHCTVCHERLDPVAGTFQNYDEEGHYRSADGRDSLDGDYKENPPGGADVLVEARSWEEREVVATDGYLVRGENTIGLRAVAEHDDVELGLDRLTIRDADGREVISQKLVRLRGARCGERDGGFFRLYTNCIMGVAVSVTQEGVYTAEVEAWAWDENRTYPVRLRLWAPGYIHQEGDTWYRDMRPPGFAGEQAPDADNSAQWLAERIVAHDESRRPDDDVRGFAEATVNFWWPAIHGSEVLSIPGNEDDVDFEGIALASDAQRAEVKRLAEDFRAGIRGGAPYNLKDLLVEMAVSKWFRADSAPDDDAVRSVALLQAGAKRLLTPEELARKTLALTGVQWGREWRQPHHGFGERHTRLTHTYGTLYGGIDSDGITERARDMNAVMAGVAKRHAVEVSCPVVLREFYLLPDERRLLFEGIDLRVTPMSEFGEGFSISASSEADKQALSVNRSLSAGRKLLRLTFENDYYSESEPADRNVRLDSMAVRNVADGSVVWSFEFEDHASGECGHPDGDHYLLWGGGRHCALEVDGIELPADGDYAVEVVAWADQAGSEHARLRMELESTDGNSIGATKIRSKLVALHDRLLGVRVTADSADIADTYDLFVDVWTRKREIEDDHFHSSAECHWQTDNFFLQGFLDDYRLRWKHHHDDGWHYNWNDSRIDEFWGEKDLSDPEGVGRTWTVVLMGLLMDQRFLHL